MRPSECSFCRDAGVDFAVRLKEEPDEERPACRGCAAMLVQRGRTDRIVDALAVWPPDNVFR